MLFYSNLKSHPDKRLEEHLFNVASISKDIFNDLNIENKDLYKDLAFMIGLCHDFAKSTSFFQDKLCFKKVSEKARHGFLSAIFGYFVVKEYCKEYNLDYDFPSLAFIIISRHHTNLKNISGFESSREDLDKYYDLCNVQLKDIKKSINDSNKSLNIFYSKFNVNLSEFIDDFDGLFRELRSKLLKLSINHNVKNYMLIILFYSVLLDADKIDASKTTIPNRKIIPGNNVDIYKKEKFKITNDIDLIRNTAYDEVISNILEDNLNHKIFSIDLPTGTGKTLVALSTSLKLKEFINNKLNFNPRIIYCLPFLSIIDQNEKVFSDVLSFNNFVVDSSIMLKHNYLSDMSYKVDCSIYSDLSCNNSNAVPLNNSRILIEGWNSEIIITTFIQFFYSLIGNKNRSFRKFHNIVNSIIILDEIQAIPFKYWKILNIILSFLANEFNSWIILMTATQPLIFDGDNGEIFPLVKNREYYYDNFDRIIYQFNLEDINFDSFKENIINEINLNNNKDFMFVMNTINSSKELYQFIKDYFSKLYSYSVDESNGIVNFENDIQLIYLSTNIIPNHRLKRINEIKFSNKRHIIVTTQLIEAGVDISVDIVYRDLAPLDSIIQTAGRCNRNNGDEKGIVHIVSLLGDNGKSFWSYVYNSVLINATKDVLKKFIIENESNIISEKLFNLNASKDYYLNVLNRGSDEPSDYLLEVLEKLNFSEITKNFELIAKTVEKVDVFVEVDKKSKNLMNKFKNIQNNQDNNYKNEFLEFKSEFYDYIVSVDSNKVGATNICGWVFYISSDDLKHKYDVETGFIPT